MIHVIPPDELSDKQTVDLRKIFKLLDVDKAGTINPSQYQAGMRRYFGLARPFV